MAVELHETREYKREDRSVLQLLRDITREATALLEDEVNLARREVSERIGSLGNGMSHLVIGALVFFAGLMVLLDAVVVALAQVFPPQQLWLAPLLVGGLVLIVGAILLANGRRKLDPANLKPQRTLDESRRDRNMIKEKLS